MRWSGWRNTGFIKKKFTLAIHYADEAISTAGKTKLITTLRDAYQEAGNIEVATGNVTRYPLL